jgi:hypothetical protein
MASLVQGSSCDPGILASARIAQLASGETKLRFRTAGEIDIAAVRSNSGAKPGWRTRSQVRNTGPHGFATLHIRAFYAPNFML